MSGESGAKRNQQQKSAFICTMILRLLHYLPSCSSVASPSLISAQFQRKEM